MSEEFPQILENLLRYRLSGVTVPVEMVWFAAVIATAVTVLMFLRLANWRLRRSFEASGSLQSISISLEAEGAVIVGFYEFRFRGRTFAGAGVIPLAAFAGNQTPAWLGSHDWLDLPVLRLNDAVYVGEEAIEHALLAMRSSIKIRFLSGDPSRNSPVVELPLPEHNDYLTS